MHTRDSAFRMQLSTWTGWLLSFLSACDSVAKIIVRVEYTGNIVRCSLIDMEQGMKVCPKMYVNLWNCHVLVGRSLWLSHSLEIRAVLGVNRMQPTGVNKANPGLSAITLVELETF